jgi:hypothetical protein
MRLSTLTLVLAVVWAASAVLSGLLAGRKARNVRRWTVLGVVLGPLSLLVHAFYPARYRGETMPCPRCGKPVATRAVACYHCQYRFPAMDVLITGLPADPESRRVVVNEVAREYGLGYAEAEKMLAELPVAGYRHIFPLEVAEYVRRLEKVGASVEVVPSAPESPGR